jgi:hypothetical protein
MRHHTTFSRKEPRDAHHPLGLTSPSPTPLHPEGDHAMRTTHWA